MGLFTRFLPYDCTNTLFSSPISWSKNGFIAFAHHTSSTNLSISKLESLRGQSWRLSSKKSYEIKTASQTSCKPIQVVVWSPSGADLLVVDQVGGVSILGTGIVKNGNVHQLSCFEDVEILYQDDAGRCEDESLSKCVAFKWINVDKPVISSSPAVFSEEQNRYNYSVHQYKPYGFLHPNGKSGCFIARRDGSVDFYYQGITMEFKKHRILLEPEREWVSQASIGFLRDGDVVVVCYCPKDQSLKVYKLSVSWNLKSCEPNFKVEKLLMERLNKIGSNGLTMELDQIEVISPNYSMDTDLDILIAFKGIGCNNRTLLQKYQISTVYKDLRFKTDGGTVEGFPNLVLKAEDYLDGELLDIELKNFDMNVIVTSAAGRVHLRSRKNLQLHIGASSTMSSLLDCGFEFPMTETNPDCIAVCPSMAGFVSLTSGVLEFHPVVRKSQNAWDAKDILKMSSGIAYLFCSACYTNTIADELIALILNEFSKLDPELRYEIIVTTLKESHRSLNFTLDISKEQIDRLLVNPPMQKLLSLQYSLGKFLPTNQQSTIALAILNLRLISFSIMVTLRTLFHQQQRIVNKGVSESLIDGVYRSESVLSTVGTINWLIDFVIFTIQELMKLSQGSGHESIIVTLLLSTVPRSLLIYSLAGVKKIDGVLTKVMEQHMQTPRPSSLNVEILQKSAERFKSLLELVELEHFEKFLMQIETLIPQEKENRLSVEQAMVFECKLTGNFAGLDSRLLSLFQQHYEEHPLSELFFHDTRWLKLDVAPNTIPSKVLLSNDDPVPIVIDLSTDLIDDVTKMVITNKEKLKRCLRCEYIRGDNDDVFYIMGKGITGSTNHWPVAYNRTCLCGSCWAYLSGDECSL